MDKYQTMRLPFKLCIVLLITVLLGACSAVRLVYNQADTLLSWMASDYFDFDPTQKQDFNARLGTLLKWHRQEHLPEYAQFLVEVQRRAEKPSSIDDARWLAEGAKARYRMMTRKMASEAAEVLTTLNADNLRALEKAFDKDNDKFTREYKLNGKLEGRRRARLDRNLKRIRDWSGPLTREQEARITALSDALPDGDHLRLQDRKRRQKEFLVLLGNRQSQNKAELTRSLDRFLADWETGRPPELAQGLNEAFDKRVAMYLEADRMLNAEQRAHVAKALQGYIDDVRALIGR